MNFRVRWAWLLAGLTLMLIGRTAEAAPRVVLIARASRSTPDKPPSPAQTETDRDAAPSQIEAELRAAGYEVVRAEADDAAAEDLRRAAESRQAIAAIGVFGTAAQPVADVWVTDRTLGKTVIRRVTAEGAPDDAPRVLALEVVETLHASLVEIGSIPPSNTPPEPPAPGAIPPAAPPAPVAPRAPLGPHERDRTDSAAGHREEPGTGQFRIALGLGVLTGASDLPLATPAFAAHAGYRFSERWCAEVAWFGPAMSRVTASATQGTAHAKVDQELVSARLSATPSRDRSPIEPFGALGIGVERIGATGSIDDETATAAGYRGSSTSAWFPFGELAVGARWHMSRGLALVGAAAAGATVTRPVLRFGTDTRSTQLPLVSVTASVEASW